MLQGRKTKIEVKAKDDTAVKSHASVDNCSRCSKPVKDSDAGLQCEICELWFHNACENITDEEFKFLEAHSSVHWYCEACNKSVANVIKLVTSLKTKHEKLELVVDALRKDVTKISATVDSLDKSVDTKIESGIQDTKSSLETAQKEINEIKASTDSMTSEVKCLSATLSEMSLGKLPDAMLKVVETKIESYTEKLSAELACLGKEFKALGSSNKDPPPLWSSLVSKEVDSKFDKVSVDVSKFQQALDEARKESVEEKDREERSNNIIIYRINELDSKEELVKSDRAFCLELIKDVLGLEMQESDIKQMFRIGKKVQDKGPRPLLIQFREKAIKNKIMESLSKLRDADDRFKSISVTHDFTKTERAECKSLVEQAKVKQLEESGEYLWRVRGAPGQLKLIKFRKQ